MSKETKGYNNYMPHIHTKPGQHDMTVSAYIVRLDGPEPRCLVHMHRKIDRLMQVGGHIELTQTPWQAMVAELREESGYELYELELLQPVAVPPQVSDGVVHPVPFLVNTHAVGNEHYHSDLCYGFIAAAAPGTEPEAGESADMRWLTLSELRQLASNGVALQDVADIYAFLLDKRTAHYPVDPSLYPLDKPAAGIEYKR